MPRVGSRPYTGTAAHLHTVTDGGELDDTTVITGLTVIEYIMVYG